MEQLCCLHLMTRTLLLSLLFYVPAITTAHDNSQPSDFYRIEACIEESKAFYNATGKRTLMFQCDLDLNVTKCVTYLALNNGSEECLDGYDEGSHGVQLLEALKMVVSTVKGGKSTSRQAKSCYLHTLPNGCTASKPGDVSCFGPTFNESSFLDFKPAECFRTLNITNGNIKTIRKETLSMLTGLVALIIDNSRLSYLENGAFREQKNLVFLKLRDNKLTDISLGGFDGLSSLQMLYLDGNQLTNLSDLTSFRGLQNVRELSVRRNKISTLSIKNFVSSNWSIRRLDISHNQLSNVYRLFKFLSALTQLQQLNISYNNLNSVKQFSLPDEAFDSYSGEGVEFGVSRASYSQYPILPTLTTLDLSGNQLDSLTEGFAFSIPNVRKLILNNNDLTTVHSNELSSMRFLRQLSLAGNKLSGLPFLQSLNSSNLELLDVRRNSLNHLNASSFHSVGKLVELDISYNPILKIVPNVFAPLKQLHKLRLTGIQLQHPTVELFAPLKNLIIIELKEYSYCRFVPHVKMCIFEKNAEGTSSFYNLLESPVLRCIVWVLAALTTIGNSLVIATRISSEKASKTLPIIQLALADFLMGIYLLILAAKDTEYRGEYNIHALPWTHSWACKVSGFLAMTSCEQTIFMLCLIAVERAIVIINPLEFREVKPMVIKVVCVLLWCLAIALGSLPFFPTPWSEQFYSSSDVCFPLFISNPSGTGWQYSLFLLVCVNGCSIILMLACYACIFYSIYIYQSPLKFDSVPKKEYSVAFRLFFVILTDAFCWIPVITIKMLALANPETFHISGSVHAWITIVVIPINSAVNPWLYTFTTTNFKNMILDAKKNYRRRCGHDSFRGTESLKRDPNHTTVDSASRLTLSKLFKKSDSNLSAKTVQTVLRLQSNLDSLIPLEKMFSNPETRKSGGSSPNFSDGSSSSPSCSHEEESDGKGFPRNDSPLLSECDSNLSLS